MIPNFISNVVSSSFKLIMNLSLPLFLQMQTIEKSSFSIRLQHSLLYSNEQILLRFEVWIEF